jgi:hypothetical protein
VVTGVVFAGVVETPLVVVWVVVPGFEVTGMVVVGAAVLAVVTAGVVDEVVVELQPVMIIAQSSRIARGINSLLIVLPPYYFAEFLFTYSIPLQTETLKHSLDILYAFG